MGQLRTCSLKEAEWFPKGGAGESQRLALMSFTPEVAGPHTHFLAHTKKKSPCKNSGEEAREFQWFRESDQAAHPAVLPTEGRLNTISGQAQGPETYTLWVAAGKLTCQRTDTAQGPLQRLRLFTWSESSVTRSPSLVIPSSFRSFRWGHRARQKALATCSVSRLWSAGSLRQLCWSSFSRKNTWSPNKREF